MNMENYSIVMPGRIVEFFPDNQTATVRISANNIIYNSKTSEVEDDFGELYDVPVHVPSGGGFALTMPIAPDDTCLLLFSQFGYDHWLWEDKDKPSKVDAGVAPWSRRKFSQKDGLCLVGFNTVPRAITDYSTTDTVLRSSDGTQSIALKPGGEIAIQTPTTATVNAPATNWAGVLNLTGASNFTGPMNLMGSTLTGLAAPAVASAAATKSYTDSLVATKLSNVEDDTSPTLGGNLDGGRKYINNLLHVGVSGKATDYSAAGDFVPDYYSIGTRTFTYANITGLTGFGIPDGTQLPPVLKCSTVIIMDQHMFILGGGFLFHNIMQVKNKVGRTGGTTIAGIVSLADQGKYTADTNPVSLAGVSATVLSSPTFDTVGAGTMDGTNITHSGVQANLDLTTANVTNFKERFGINFTETTGAGGIKYQAGIRVAPLTKGSLGNTAILFGAGASVPAGNFGLHQADEQRNRLNGAVETKIRVQAVGKTMDYTDGNIEYTGAGAASFTLPAANTCKGRVHTFSGTGAGNISLVPTGSDKIGGTAATLVMSGGAGQFRTYQSNGVDNWVRIG